MSHNHGGGGAITSIPTEGKFARTGTRRYIKKKEKCNMKRENDLKQLQELPNFYFNEGVAIK